MSFRLVILTEIISPYRIPVFNALARDKEIDLHVIFLAETDPSMRQWRVYKDEIDFSYEVLPSFRRRLGRYNLLLNWGMAATLHRNAPDVILCGGYSYLASWEAMWWAGRNRVPLFLWVESTSMDRRGGHAVVEALKKRFMHRCDGFVVPGRSSFEYLRSLGAEEETIHTAPNAVDIALFSVRAEEVRRDATLQRKALRLPFRFFLYAGRLVEEKGVFDLLQAYGTLDPQLRAEIGLVFVGDGPARTDLERQACTITGKSVHFAGFVHREQLASYYALAEAFVFPTHTDTWGLVVNEAMACGLPIIASRAAGCVADLVEHNWNGHTIVPGDTLELARAMDELARAPERRSSMARNSRQRIQCYSPDACAAGIAAAVRAAEVVAHG